MSTQLKKFLQINELFAQDPTVSKEFPTLASPRLYLVILSNLCVEHSPRHPKVEGLNPATAACSRTEKMARKKYFCAQLLFVNECLS